MFGFIEHLSNCHGEVSILCGGFGLLLSGGAVWISMKVREWSSWMRGVDSEEADDGRVE